MAPVHSLDSWNLRPGAGRLKLVRRTPLLATLMLTVFGACADSEREPSARPPHSPGRGAASEVDNVSARGHRYEITCAQPGDEQMGAPIGLEEPDPRFTGAWAVNGQDPDAVIALQADGRAVQCPDATYILAFVFASVTNPESAASHARLRCHVPAVPADPRCAEGGPFWFGTDPSEDGTEGDGRSAVWVEGRVPEPDWRQDPLEVAAREVAVTGDVPAFYQLRRVGLRLIEQTVATVVVEAVHENVVDNNGKPYGTLARERHTLRPQPGRRGWYPAEFIVVEYGQAHLDHDELDRAWSGIDRVLLDVDRRSSTADSRP